MRFFSLLPRSLLKSDRDQYAHIDSRCFRQQSSIALFFDMHMIHQRNIFDFRCHRAGDLFRFVDAATSFNNTTYARRIETIRGVGSGDVEFMRNF
jgi:hypothetical protein